MNKECLFYNNGELRNFLEENKEKIKSEINGLDENYILNVNEENLAESLVDNYKVTPISINFDKKSQLPPKEINIPVNNFGRKIEIKGAVITIVIPVEGTIKLLNYLPSMYFSSLPRGKIVQNEIYITYEISNDNVENLKQQLNHDLDLIGKYAQNINTEIVEYNNSLKNYIENEINIRKSRILSNLNLVNSLNIPIKKREDFEQTYFIPIKKKIEIKLPQKETPYSIPEPILSEEIYEDILKILKNMSLMIERSPTVFNRMKEEHIRDIFLVFLNGVFEGQAMGEVFNNQGRTDILIRYNGKNVFIAECKFWDGEKVLLNTIDQLLNYTSWRDIKTAILLFYKDKNFTDVLKKINNIMLKHQYCKRAIDKRGETDFRFIFHQPDDKNREIILTIMLFNIPDLENTKKETKKIPIEVAKIQKTITYSDKNLEDKFHQAMMDLYTRIKAECQYNPTRFLQMLTEYGGVETAKILVSSPQPHEGFIKLWELKRPDLTVEFEMLKPEWKDLFSDEEKNAAKKRLKSVGYEIKYEIK